MICQKSVPVLLNRMIKRFDKGYTKTKGHIDQETYCQYFDMLCGIIQGKLEPNELFYDFLRMIYAAKMYDRDDELPGFTTGVLWGSFILFERFIKSKKEDDQCS